MYDSQPIGLLYFVGPPTGPSTKVSLKKEERGNIVAYPTYTDS
jgi:hypothetical protein